MQKFVGVKFVKLIVKLSGEETKYDQNELVYHLLYDGHHFGGKFSDVYVPLWEVRWKIW